MRILHVITSLLTGGAEKLMVDLLPRMKAKGHDVELCVFAGIRTSFMDELEKKGVKIHCLNDSWKIYNVSNIWKLRKLIHGDWDIIHTHNTAPQFYAAIANIGLGKILVTTEHNTTNRRRGNIILKQIDRWMYECYSCIIAISDQAKDNYTRYFANSTSVCTIYNGIDYNLFSTATPAEDIAKFNCKIITNIAAFRAQKDQPTLIRGMKFLPEHYHLCLVGGDNADRQSEFESLISTLNLQNQVHLLGLRTDVPNILAASDYVVMCSHYEGLSLSSLEGMASGKPFLADDVDGLREVVADNGVLFAHEDSKGFAKSIMELEYNPSYRAEIIKKCQAKAKQYDINVTVERYLQEYSKIISSVQ